MFNKKNYKKVIITVLALTMILGTVALAAEGIYTKQLTATYGQIKFNYEGRDVTSQIESKYGTPAFASGGRAYAPVRAMADILGIDIDYDNNTHTVKITDPKAEKYEKQLDDKDVEIAKLKKELENIKAEVKKEEEKKEEAKVDLKSLEKDLNKKYSEYEKVEFDIVLKENKDKITIDINTDLRNTTDKQYWIRMRHTDKKYLIEDIVAQVKKEFKNADITGNIYDSYSRSNLYSFSQTKNGNLSITNRDSIGNGDYDKDGYGNLDSYVKSEFEKKGIYDARLYDSNYGKWDNFEISFSSDYRYEWDDLGDSGRDSILYNIAREIEDEYYYNSNYDNDYVSIDIIIGGSVVGRYDRYKGYYKY